MKLVSLFSFIATVQSFSSYSSIQLPNYEERGDEILHIQPNDLLVVDLLRRLTSTLLFPWQMRHFFCVGDCVTLVTGYQQYHDAIHGPLKPGDEGVMISCDIHSGVIRALVLVSGRTWYYDKRALRRASANRGPTKSTMSMQGATGLSAGAVPANLHPNHAASTSAPLPPGAAAAVAAPAAASPGAGGFTFGALPAAGSPPFGAPGAAAAKDWAIFTSGFFISTISRVFPALCAVLALALLCATSYMCTCTSICFPAALRLDWCQLVERSARIACAACNCCCWEHSCYSDFYGKNSVELSF